MARATFDTSVASNVSNKWHGVVSNRDVFNIWTAVINNLCNMPDMVWPITCYMWHPERQVTYTTCNRLLSKAGQYTWRGVTNNVLHATSEWPLTYTTCNRLLSIACVIYVPWCDQYRATCDTGVTTNVHNMWQVVVDSMCDIREVVWPITCYMWHQSDH